MAHPLKGLAISVVVACAEADLTWPLARGFARTWEQHGFPVKCARVFFCSEEGKAMPDTADVVYDPWLRRGFVVYGDKCLMASGGDPQTVVWRWFPAAVERGF